MEVYCVHDKVYDEMIPNIWLWNSAITASYQQPQCLPSHFVVPNCFHGKCMEEAVVVTCCQPFFLPC